MKPVAGLLAAIVAGAAVAGCEPAPERAPAVYDVLLTGGLVYDGSLEVPTARDVAVKGDRVAFLGDAADDGISADLTIDVTGLIVSPGFVDPHTHTLEDVTFHRNRNQLENYLTQGVTTVVAGNDGSGPSNIGRALAAIEERGVGPNFALFTGHGTIRVDVLGREDRPPSADELELMQTRVREALDEGALGLSTGLYYAPASYAETDEIIALAEVAAEFDALYESHIRDESSYSVGLLAAVDEALEIGRQSGAAVHLAHIKALGTDVWGQSAAVIDRVEAAQAEGLRVTADQYPWSASGTRISNALIPNWVKAGSQEEMFARLRDPDNQARLRSEISENLRKRGGAEAILLVARAEGLESRTLAAEAEVLGMDVVDAAIAIVLGGDSRIASFNMQETDIAAFMRQPWVVTSSDGTNGHPRKFASFPRKYRTYVVENEVITLTEFIHRSSALTADILGLCDRGRLAVGAFADIVVFDPEAFRDRADFGNPTVLSEGVVHLFVNGEAVISDGEILPVLPGRSLRRDVCDPVQSEDSGGTT